MCMFWWWRSSIHDGRIGRWSEKHTFSHSHRFDDIYNFSLMSNYPIGNLHIGLLHLYTLIDLSLASTHSCLRLSSILYLTKRCCSLNMEHYCRLPPPSLPHCYTNKLVLLWTTFLSIPAKFICFIIYLNSLVVTNQYIQLFGYLCILPSLLFLIFLSPLCFSFNIRIQFQ